MSVNKLRIIKIEREGKLDLYVKNFGLPNLTEKKKGILDIELTSSRDDAHKVSLPRFSVMAAGALFR